MTLSESQPGRPPYRERWSFSTRTGVPPLAQTTFPACRAHYPVSAVLWPSPSPSRAALLSENVGVRLRPDWGSPTRPDHLPGMPCPLPRRTRTGARVGCFPVGAAFPVLRAGRRPHQHFRGLLRLHSRYGLQGCSATRGGLGHKAPARSVTRPSRLSATRLTDYYLGGTSTHW